MADVFLSALCLVFFFFTLRLRSSVYPVLNPSLLYPIPHSLAHSVSLIIHKISLFLSLSLSLSEPDAELHFLLTIVLLQSPDSFSTNISSLINGNQLKISQKERGYISSLSSVSSEIVREIEPTSPAISLTRSA